MTERRLGRGGRFELVRKSSEFAARATDRHDRDRDAITLTDVARSRLEG
jgi:hypothetical protein